MTARIQREHILQVRIREFVRDAVDAPHEFLAFDRSAAGGQFTHDRERSRGIRSGTADTLLMVAGMPDIWVELKRRGEKPEPGGDQEKFGEAVIAVGRMWFWADTVESYHQGLVRCGVPLRANAAFQAMHKDGRVDTIIAKAEVKRGKAHKTAKPRKAGHRNVASGARARRMQRVGIF